ncbi:MAG: pyrimidine 5'-nucleotidase [Anaerolineales bacterium]|nr:pyrimidine 5'-nucleotidase [Anaerolineales bacterium]MDW8161806.1 pyrimidine 5'-nucleotidase [Anaerolineales bacterium]
MDLEVAFFDLDDTLYDKKSGLWEAIRQRMSLYMHERLGMSWEIIPSLRRHYFETYGTTLRGLQLHHQVDPEDYLAFVHDLPIHEFIQPDPELRHLILSMPLRRFVFTNADRNHAQRVLQRLNLTDCFEGIIDIRAVRFYCKPEPQAYQIALDIAQVQNPQRCIYFDDTLANLITARKIGFFTVLVGQEDLEGKVDLWVEQLKELPQKLPALWDNHRGSNGRTEDFAG